MNANAGAGKVIEKAVPLLEHVKLSKSQMMACKHANGKDWWLIKQWSEENKIVKFLIKKDTVLGPYYQSFSGTFSLYDQSGQSMFSLDGSQYATTCRGTNKVFLAHFDRCTGEFSNPFWVNVPNYSRHDPSDTTLLDLWTQGLAFSPSGKFLYIMKYWNILQLDLNDPDSSSAWSHIADLDTSWDAFQLYSSGYLGKNFKLYIGTWTGLGDAMSIINSPDLKGSACDFCPKCLRFPDLGVNTPPCMPNYDLGPLTPCWPLTNQDIGDNNELIIYPNPTSNSLFIQSDLFKQGVNQFCIYDMLGQKVIDEKRNNSNGLIGLDINRLNAGVYFLRVGRFVKKFVKE